MWSAITGLFRRRYVGLQIAAVLLWLALELVGYGVGLLSFLTRRGVTDAAPPGLRDLVDRPPPGPMRLDPAAQKALAARLAAAFPDGVPAHMELKELRQHYVLESGALCESRRGITVAGDGRDCNRIRSSSPFFTALLKAMHPRTQHLILRETAARPGGRARAAFFVGTDETPRILLDLSGVASEHWDFAKGFRLLASHGGGIGATELKLGEPVAIGERLFLIADPGQFRRTGMCPPPGCPAQLIIKGFDAEGTEDLLGKPVAKTIAEIVLDEVLERRFRFYDALRGRPAAPPPQPRLETRYAPVPFAVTTYTVRLMRTEIERAVAGSIAELVFAPIGFHVAFGTVIAFRKGDAIFIAWDGGAPYASIGTDRMLVRYRIGGRLIEPQTRHGGRGVYVVPGEPCLPQPAACELVVHKAIAPDDPPWSGLDDVAPLLRPLMTQP